MISHPKKGDRVQVHYGKGWRRVCSTLHGRVGVVQVASKGRPRNHGVEIDGQLIIVPAGNLVRPQTGQESNTRMES